MPERLSRAQQYRNMAEMLRKIARDTPDTHLRESAAKVADDYEHMASDLEQSAASSGVVRHNVQNRPH